MNVFEAIGLNELDPIDREFITAETTLDIAVARAEKEYVFESGLIELNDNTLFIESETNNNTSNEKKSNAFIKFVKTVCTAIRNFIGDIITTITNLFDKRENITAEDYLDSSTGQIRLKKDVEKLEAVIDDEIRKGNKLLQKISSVTGISDEVIDEYIRSGIEKVKKIAPVVIPALVGFGFRSFFRKSFNKHSKDVDDAEKNAINGDNSDPKKTKQKKTVIGHINWLLKQLDMVATDWAAEMRKAKKRAKK